MTHYVEKFCFLTIFVAALLFLTNEKSLAADTRNPDVDPSSGIIVIDPGHGGYDIGASGGGGITEKEVTLALARLIASQLEGRYRVRLTRTGDYRVDRADRIAVANHNQADLFLSLHVGGGFSMENNMVTVFYLNHQSQPETFEEPYNVSDFPIKRPPAVWDQAHQDHGRLNKAFANILGRACRKTFGDISRVKTGQIIILQGADMPAAMIEIGCLANPEWEKKFRDTDHLVSMSDMICKAIDRFFQAK